MGKRTAKTKNSIDSASQPPLKKKFALQEVVDFFTRDSDEDPSEQESDTFSFDSEEEQLFAEGCDPVHDCVSSDNEASSDNWLPQASLVHKPAAKKRGRGRTKAERARGSPQRSQSPPFTDAQKWSGEQEIDVQPPPPVFKPNRDPGPQLALNRTYTPFEMFRLFFSHTVLHTILANTNTYGAKMTTERSKPWVDISLDDLKAFIAIVIYMGLVKCSSLKDYWKTSKLYNMEFPGSVMPARKFYCILSALHLSDPKADQKNEKRRGRPAFDRLGKIKPLYQQISAACKANFHPRQNVAVVERMVATKARISSKQYMKNKPTKWGYKLFVLADSSCGYTWNFFVYEGKCNTEQSKGLSYDSVMGLTDVSLLGSGYKLYVDNFYTSPLLFRDLLKKNIWACGTIRPNRIGFPRTTQNDLCRNAQRGSLRWIRDQELLFLKWKGTREVLMCSTLHKAYDGDTVRRRMKGPDGQWELGDVPIPSAVKDYDKYMGGVDPSDALIGYYNVYQKTRKWYKIFFFHVLEIAVVNAFLLHKELFLQKNEKPLTQKAFREQLILELSTKRRTLTSDPAPVLAPGNAPHWPKHTSDSSTTGRKRCRVCHRCTPVMCVCQVPLCFLPGRDCFTEWHKKNVS